MEQMSILSILLMVSGWIQHSGATNCSVYLSSQPLTLNLLCPSATCRLELLNMRNCSNACNIIDCNRVYNHCNATQSGVNVSNEFSPQQLSSNGQISHSSELSINCTIIEFSRELMWVTCVKKECTLTFQTNTTACNRDLGINNRCNQGNSSAMCIRVYNFCMEPQPNTCPSLSETVTTATLNQCTNSVTIQTHTKEVTVTTFSPTLIYISTTVHVSVHPSPTTSINSHITTCSSTNTIQGIPLNIAIPATGGLVGLPIVLLLVVIVGCICTCRIMKKRGKMEINVMQNRPCMNSDRHTYTKTPRRFDNPLCEEQQQSTCATPPQTKPKPPQQQIEEPAYAISLVTHRRDIGEPKNIQNRPNHTLSGGNVSVGGATPIQKKQGEIEHKYDRLVKVVKQTERCQSKRDETISLERNCKHQTVNKQERDTSTYHIQDYLTPIRQESKNSQTRPYKSLLPDGGASVGAVTQFPPRKQGEIEHQYDHLVEVGKQKGSQSKRDERVNGGIMDHDYHVLEGPDNDYDDLDEQERETVYHILNGPTPVEPELKTFQNRPRKVFPVGGVSVGGATEFPRKQKAYEHQYDHLVKKKGGQCKTGERADEERNHGYHVLEGPGNDDYDYSDEQEGEIVYHVLDGPTPVEEETQFTY